MVMAQWRDGKSNYIIETVAKRHGLQQIVPGTVKGHVGIYNGRSALRMGRRVVFQIQPETKEMGDVLLGTDFRRMLEDLEQWETTSTQEDGTF
jgi:hypothetical protein